MKGAWHVLLGDEINWAADLLRRYPLALLSEWEKEVEGCDDGILPRGGGRKRTHGCESTTLYFTWGRTSAVLMP